MAKALRKPRELSASGWIPLDCILPDGNKETRMIEAQHHGVVMFDERLWQHTNGTLEERTFITLDAAVMLNESLLESTPAESNEIGLRKFLHDRLPTADIATLDLIWELMTIQTAWIR